MLHPALLSELLDDEVVVINERLSVRGVTARRDGHHVHIRAPEVGEERILVLDAEKYDGEPVGSPLYGARASGVRVCSTTSLRNS